MPSPLWSELIVKLRPGSRTLLYYPQDVELVEKFARRGFRLMLVHDDQAFLLMSKQRLRDLGLMSQLMGTALVESEQPLSLAKAFYEIFILGRVLRPVDESFESSIKAGGQVIGLTGALSRESSEQKIERLPPGFEGYRV